MIQFNSSIFKAILSALITVLTVIANNIKD